MASLSTGRRVGLLIGLAFLACSWAWRGDGRLGKQIRSLVYPFDTFSMYATHWQTEVSIPLLRDSHGVTHYPYDFSGFQCTPAAQPGPGCDARRSIGYHDDELLRHVHSHPPKPGEATQSMTLVRRRWALQAGVSPKQLGDCELQRCEVQP